MNMRVVLLAATAPLVAVFGSCTKEARTSEAEVRSTVERLFPIGSAPQDALRALDSLRVEHSSYGPNRLITANFGPTSNDGLVSGAVFVELYFDNSDRLIRREVKEIFTGP
jgi:hypothetical protein